MSLSDDDLTNPPASRPTWTTLAYAAAFALAATLLAQWPAILRALGVTPDRTFGE